MAVRRSAEEKMLAKIASWPEPFAAIGSRLHELVVEAGPRLTAKPFYGSPGYATDGPVLVFFRVDEDVMTFGITEKGRIDVRPGADEKLVPSAWFVTGLDADVEAQISDVVRRAVG